MSVPGFGGVEIKMEKINCEVCDVLFNSFDFADYEIMT